MYYTMRHTLQQLLGIYSQFCADLSDILRISSAFLVVAANSIDFSVCGALLLMSLLLLF